MATGTGQADLLDEVLSCRRRVVALCGPAGSGKTTAALDLYEHFQRGREARWRPGCLLLAPNRLTVRWLRRKLLDRSSCGALISPRVMTFGDLAGEILLAARVPHRPILPIHRRMVLEGIIADLADRGRFKALDRVVDTPGLVTAVDRSIGELKRAAVEPSRLADSLDGADDKHRDLLTIYATYQEYLSTRELYDEEGRLWEARDRLTEMARLPLEGIGAVVADGFTDFTPTQLAILQLLAGRVDRLVITLPHEAVDASVKLWQWTTRQLRRIEEAFGHDLEVMTARGDHTVATGRQQLCRRLFAAQADPVDWPSDVALVAAAGLESECRAIARWVKRHLADGTPADELVVVARDIEPYRRALSRVFPEADLPTPPVTPPLAQTPLGRFLMAVAGVADGYASSDVLAVVSSSYFRAEALGDFDTTTATAAQLVIRQGNVVAGRSGYARAADRLAAWAEKLQQRTTDEEFATPLDRHLRRLGAAAVQRAGRLLEALLDRLDPIASGGSPSELARAFQSAMDGLGVGDSVAAGADDETVAANLRALSGVQATLGQLASLTEGPGLDRPLSAAQFVHLLRRLLREMPCPPARPGGAIVTAGALDARAVRARHVWLAGMNEGVFPARPGEGALIGEADRLAWRQRGLPLDARDDLAAREMLLFYLTLGRPDETLTVSWLYSDSGGRAMQRSAFVDSLVRPAGGAELLQRRVTTLPPAEFAPPAERMISRREALNAALACAAASPDSPQRDGWLAALQWARQTEGPMLRRIAGALWAASRRWRRGPCDAYDGVLDDRVLLAELAQTVPAKTLFSASRIQTYLSCPWRYFAERCLRLTEPAEPEDALLPRRFGLLVHAVLRRLVAVLGRAGPVATSSLTGPEALSALDQAIAAEAAEVEVTATPQPALWASELRRLRSAIVAYLHRQAAGPMPPGEILHVELAFGMPGSIPGDEDGPLVLPGPAGEVRLRGKIDRVDMLLGIEGSRQALVIDYKTGSLPVVNADVQLPVYIKAAEQLTGLASTGGAFHGVRVGDAQDRYLAQFKPSRAGRKENEAYPRQLSEGLDRVHQAVAGIAAGQFAVIDAHRCAAGRCPFRRICGYSDSRATFKGIADREAHDD